ncbi:crossover junction endodeoxyribonuclease [Aspergillus saccharolyticus JOP 1030-1]|uniref:PIN domain-like protein n=1 Tax=Aspergillus saccharolyticus JOP 1030-1 TaxID=1450539 RepID=A0A318YYR2_9EURO|nr:PIN domain-like protein [Aspergillus saccharolyticus JOP 1030-1]PYH40141.1 PIN domain-like protein [Aspergillus saccharolyticus JOP 1030-1]
MGIPGLTQAIGTGERIALSKLAIGHLERNARPIRVAVDISIWLFQVRSARGGRNPELRTLFYRLLKILALPIHPLFVYDGPHKPPFKRGRAVTMSNHGKAPIIRLSKILVDLFRFPRHDAPGEAEAECARLQKVGVVDAVMSNDVDALMFGSTFTVMNFSKESGTGTAAATHVTCYSMDSIAPESPSKVMLDRAGMILFAMLSGGDYLPSGVPKCGSKLAGEIAKAGFGEDLLEILDSNGPDMEERLREWRERLQYELEENESGYFQTKHKVVRVPETFPDKTILSYYAKPVVSTTSEIGFLRRRLEYAWDKEIDAVELRRFAADTFDWNYRSGARKVTKLLAEPLVCYRLRLGKQVSAFSANQPRLSGSDVPMMQKIYKCREVYSTDGSTEYQVDIVPVDVVGLDIMADEPNPPFPSPETAASAEEDDEDLENNAEPAPQTTIKKRVTKRYDPYCPEKVWISKTLADLGIPEVVENWKKAEAEKAEKANAPKKTARRTGPRKKIIDPGMKQGSILKYGFLTKERSEIGSDKRLQLAKITDDSGF